jgi:hypothetical protein
VTIPYPHQLFQWLTRAADCILDHWKSSVGVVIVGGFLVWRFLIALQKDRIELRRLRQQEKQNNYDKYLKELEQRMSDVEEQWKRRKHVHYVIFPERFYFRRLAADDHDSIREILRKRRRSPR